MYRKMLKGLLECWGYEVVLASNGYEARDIVDSDDAPRLAILNCFMPGLGGLELCELIRSRKQPYVYTILLSAADQESDVLVGFELGADDYLCKPFKEPELRARLNVGERIIRSHEELIEAHEAMRFEASRDTLLPLWNRKAIMDLLNTELSRAKRLQTPLSVFFTDLDLFKLVNDRYGHLVGDEVLRSVAEKVSCTVREYDHVGRCGGEEFLVVLPDCTSEAAREVAERVRMCVAAEAIVIGSTKVNITISIGVSQWHPGQGIRDLIHQADVALYRAKQGGRNRVDVENASAAGSVPMGKLYRPKPSGRNRADLLSASNGNSNPKGKRQELRHSLTLPVRIWGMDTTGQMFEQDATTVDVTTTGAHITGIKYRLQRGCVIGVEHCSSRARYRVTWVGKKEDGQPGEVGVQLIESGKLIWGRVIPRVFGDSASGRIHKSS
jgi:diguanylate cyclase (GGDEF)-like protein